MYLHLSTLLKPKNKWQGRTKALLMPALLVLYLIQTQEISFLIVGALLTSFLGDVGLQQAEHKKNNYELFSIAAFGITHILYTLYFILAVISTEFSFVFILPYLAALFFLRYMYKRSKGHTTVQLLYAVIITCMGASSFVYMLYDTSIYSIITFVGASLFIFSDFLISKQMNEGHKKDEVAIMVTYILAQFLIIVGIMM
jgi:hypothetical protein